MQWLFFFLTIQSFLFAREMITVHPQTEMRRLLKEKDQDKDRKITILDKISTPFELKSDKGAKISIKGSYELSNLLQELKLLSDKKENQLNLDRVKENPVERISRSIRELFWDGLTRRIDLGHLATVLEDPKLKQKKLYLYIPHEDAQAQSYYEGLKKKSKVRFDIVTLPKTITPEYVKNLNGRHGLLSLAIQKNKSGEPESLPYVVPGGRFNEMYGWDSYFIVLGLLEDGYLDLARAMVDHHVYEITHYGKILNANRTYYLTRSQPPFLTSMIRAVYNKLPKNKQNDQWLKLGLLGALKEYQEVWMGKDRLTSTGLSRYYGFGLGIPPEVEKGHYRPILAPYARKKKISVEEYARRYQAGKIKEPELDEFFLHDRAVRESGHDTTYRWRVGDKDRCADFVTVDLNSLLMKYELDFAHFIKNELDEDFPVSYKEFLTAAKRRKELMLKYFWDEKEKLFFDFNFKENKKSSYVSATTFYPLWAYDPEFSELALLDQKLAGELVKKALATLEQPGGLSSTSKDSLKKFGDPKHERQWDYPNGWAPHQMIAWSGLRYYRFIEDADRLTYKWLLMITQNAANFNGTIPEKFDVVKKSHAVFAEYGNVGTEFSYITYEGFGWMNASYQFGLKTISPLFVPKLQKLLSFEDASKE
jgi:alpha,alpha-trehalase